MKKLIFMREATDSQDLIMEKVVQEAGNSNVYIKGPYISLQKNKNGRTYLREAVDQEVKRYTNEMISTKRSFGELEHPQSTDINPDRVSHIVTELSDDSKYISGKALIIDATPCGKIARALAEVGSIGISTRSVGNVNGRGEVDAFRLICPDIVLNPSGKECFVELVTESFDMVGGLLIPTEKKVLDRMSADQYRKIVLESFSNLFGVLSKENK